MTLRFITAASVLALVSACSSQPGPSSLSPVQQGEQALRAGNFSVAEQAFKSALSAKPNDASAMLGLAQVYDASDRSAEAIELYSKVASARSGAIRTWNDGGVMQEGVTEVATRRLGALGHGMDTRVAAPAPVAEPAPVTVAAPAPAPVVQAEVWPEDPVYALDSNGMVYYADPEATQVITMPVFETREAAEQALPAVARHTVPATVPIAPIAPVVQTFAAPAPLPAPIPLAPITVTPIVTAPAPAPVIQSNVQPSEASYGLDSDGVVYFSDPDATQRVTGQVFESREAAALAAPAVTQRVISGTAPIAAAPAFAAPAPAYVDPAPVFAPAPTFAAPAPAPAVNADVAATTTALPRTSPGYAVIDGDFVYISAEDIARAGGSAASVASPSTPVVTQQSYTAPALGTSANPPLIELNGIPSINLN